MSSPEELSLLLGLEKEVNEMRSGKYSSIEEWRGLMESVGEKKVKIEN